MSRHLPPVAAATTFDLAAHHRSAARTVELDSVSSIVVAMLAALDVTPLHGMGPDVGSATTAHAALCVQRGFERIRNLLTVTELVQIDETLGAAISLAELRGELMPWGVGCVLADDDTRRVDDAPVSRRAWRVVRMHAVEAVLAICLHEPDCADLVPLVVEELEAAGEPWRVGVLVARALLTKLDAPSRRYGRGYLLYIQTMLEVAVDGPAADSMMEGNRQALAHIHAKVRMLAEAPGVTAYLDPQQIEALHEQTRTILQLVLCTEATRGARQAPYYG